MVHALQRVGQRMQPGGSLISIRPHRTWRPSISIITPSGRGPLPRLITLAFDTRVSAAEAALSRVVTEDRLTLARARDHRYPPRPDHLPQRPTPLELIAP